MKFNELINLAKLHDAYAGDIEFGPDNEFIGFVYFKSNKYLDSHELATHFSIPIQAEQ